MQTNKPNEHGVFVDAEHIDVYRQGKNYATALIAHDGAFWFSGYELWFSNGNGYAGGKPRTKERFSSRSEALASTLSRMMKMLQDEPRSPMLAAIERKMDDVAPKQLELW